jgi:hypothetical protein
MEAVCTSETLVNLYENVRFQVLTAASMKIRVFWDTPPCRVMMMEAVCTSETSVYSKQTIPEDYNLL